MDIKAIILDLDGTVLHSDKSISDDTLAVLQRCRERGILIVVATARSEAAAQRYLDQLCPDAVISNGGALVRCGGKTLFSAPLSAATADAIIAAVLALPEFLDMTVQTKRGYYVSRPPADPDRSQAIVHDFSIPLSQNAYKITVSLSRGDSLEKIAGAHPQCCLIPFAGGTWYRFASREATKMTAIGKLADHFGFTPAQTAAFGDDYNDEEMLRGCGIGIAMGNAVPEAKAAADHICDTNDNDGIAKWLAALLEETV